MEEHKLQTGSRFLLVTLLNLIITLFELIGGLLSGSLSLISDAFHNFGDAFSLILSYAANRISRRAPTVKNTYGFRRAEILAALLNSLLLVFISLFLLTEVFKRFMQPATIHGKLMFIVAVISLVANLAATILLNKDSKHNLNIKAAYLHLLGDALASIGVIISAILITIFKVYWIDPLMTLLVSLYIIYEAWPIIRQTFSILMEESPQLNFEDIQKDLLTIPEIMGVHHLHAWLIDEHELVLSVHVNMADLPLSQTECVYLKIENILQKKYGVAHVTIQAECNRGRNTKLLIEKENFQNN
ncbi:cation diffusion facilitator family transporter [Liquorilactobacillus capillatus]|uniref:CDF family cation diffusion facilitator n=1 Tax=Liquorilactobacillus capillatus DSM 19910 TaxID=1423731 RepID=A0A0R1MAT0_9LACO|nr:cation diffusion facilitator family transporter [Liquorilactobacillus capillatus]KRL00568.1 CDF family cation diffusion facilitator [Liquorilactobacillus capillatus DSM 19910]